MKQTKQWYQSATIWGVVFSTLAFLVSKYVGVQPENIPVPPNPDFQQLQAIAEQVKQAHAAGTQQTISAILGGIGAIYAIYNRVIAKAEIKRPSVAAKIPTDAPNDRELRNK